MRSIDRICSVFALMGVLTLAEFVPAEKITFVLGTTRKEGSRTSGLRIHSSDPSRSV